MEDRIGLVTAPTLVIAATEDPHAFPVTERVAGSIPGATVTEIAGGTVPLPDAMPAEFSRAILAFLAERGLLDAERPSWQATANGCSPRNRGRKDTWQNG